MASGKISCLAIVIILASNLGSKCLVGCVASTLTIDLEFGHCFGIHSIVDPCFCVLSLHREWAVLDNTHSKENGAIR